MSQGWISLHRKIRENPLFKENRCFSKFEAWIYLLLSANYRENQFLLGNQVITVNRGGLLTSIKNLADTWKWSRTKARNFLEFLQTEKMILFESTSKYTTIEILNYEKYQQIESKDFDEKSSKSTSKEHEKDMKKATTKHEEDSNNKVNKLNKVDKLNNEKEINNSAIKAPAENFNNCTFENWIRSKENNRLFSIGKKYCNKWSKMKTENIGLLIWGPPGTGKSYFSFRIANDLLKKIIEVEI